MQPPSESTPAPWRSLSGDQIDDIAGRLRTLLEEDDTVLHIGTDSKHRGGWTDFVTVLVVHHRGRGGRAFYRRERVRGNLSLANKLIHEAELSLAAARPLSEEITREIILHVDANEDRRHRSSDYASMLAGMVMGNGFQVLLKPDSWCATHVADHLVRGKHTRAA